jgi:hypothetical protein
MTKHICYEAKTCICDLSSDEPDEFCPYHGGARKEAPRCGECGRFIKHEYTEEAELARN